MKCCKKYLKVYLLETVQIYLESSFGLDYKKNQHCIVEELKKNTLENSLRLLGFCFKFNLCESLHSGCFLLLDEVEEVFYYLQYNTITRCDSFNY